MIWAVLLTATAAAALVGAEWRRSSVRYIAKPLASAGFVIVGLIALDLDSTYGLTVLVGLILGAIGDIALLGRGERSFLLGLGAFLIGHVALTVAFTGAATAALPGVPVAILFSIVVWRWLTPHVKGALRGPVVAYVLVITAMIASALGAASAHPLAALGAGLFALSDVAVARDRFVSPGVANRIWGLPLYYLAQVLIASSG